MIRVLHYVHPRSWGHLLEAILQGGPRLWFPRMRLAAAPGRFARPDPPGNDDPCGERRTILEGKPRQRRARARARNPTWSAERRASPSLGTQVPHADRMSGLPDMRRKAACPKRACQICEIDREPRSAVVRNERKAAVTASRSREATARRHKHAHARCVSVSGAPRRVPRKHPSATGAPPAPPSGAANETMRVGK